MPDTKISGLTELAARPASDDLAVLVDISDTSMAATGTDKKIQFSRLLGREVLTAARTYYVRTDGNNNNTGLVNNAGGAFLTIQKAYDTFAALDLGGINEHKIKLGNTGTFTTGLYMDKPLVGAWYVTLEGDTITPANTVISTTNSAGAILNSVETALVISAVKLITTTAGPCITADGPGSVIYPNNINFGASFAAHMAARYGGYINGSGAYTISGGAPSHYDVWIGGKISWNSSTITITGTPAFSSSFARATDGGILLAHSNTYSGSATGKRYVAEGNGVIQTFSSNINYLPGNVVGTTASGGQYA